MNFADDRSKFKCSLMLLLLSIVPSLYSQTRITPSQWEQHLFILDQLPGWHFHSGSDAEWSKKDFNHNTWEELSPAALNQDFANVDGKVEGWFRFKFIFEGPPQELHFVKCSYEPAEIYINGESLGTFGTLSNIPARNNKHLPGKSHLSYLFESGKEYILAIHVVDHLYGPGLLKPKAFSCYFLGLAKESLILNWQQLKVTESLRRSGSIAACAVMSLLMWLLAWLYRDSKELVWIALLITLYIPSIYYHVEINIDRSSFDRFYHSFLMRDVFFILGYGMYPVVVSAILIGKVDRWIWWLPPAFLVVCIINLAYWSLIPWVVYFFLIAGVSLGFFIRHRDQLTGAKWAILVGLVVSIVATIANLVTIMLSNTQAPLLGYLIQLVFPFALIIYTAIRFKEILQERNINAERLVKVQREKNALMTEQNIHLEQQVKLRTQELITSLENLKSTQAQLIHSEKMASLGELTAGIAHEIQNPLNFVNNFSDVSSELIDEALDELRKNDPAEAGSILSDLKENLIKISHHGNRASGIVKGMLNHSRASSGEKTTTDINQLVDEYLRLAYHGLRAKDSTFQAKFTAELDPDLPPVKVVAQDIGRVILNLINNAFYTVNKKSKNKTTISTYEPTVKVSTTLQDQHVQIRVQDNGQGMSPQVVKKIFQPFFTTKPTGEGTGLGLSLSYDIVTKGHGGTLTVESEEGVGTVFVITLRD